MEIITLKSPEFLHIADETGNIHLGSDQEWFGTIWQRMAGCGPSVASNVLFYLYRQGRIKLPFPVENKADFIRLMEEVWQYVTPTQRGIYSAEIWTDGVSRFLQAHGILLSCQSLEISKVKKLRPNLNEAVRFIEEGLQAECPVAFLNLSNGKVKVLDSWHWVTIVAMGKNEQGGILAQVYDAGKMFEIDFSLWYRTTKLGGGLVYLA